MGKTKTKGRTSDEVVPGRESPFNNKQRAYIRSYYKAWGKLLLKHDPNCDGKFLPILKKWRDDTADEIMLTDLFKDLSGEVMNRVQWERASLHTVSIMISALTLNDRKSVNAL